MKRSFAKGIFLGMAFMFMACSIFMYAYIKIGVNQNRIVFANGEVSELTEFEGKLTTILKYIEDYYYEDYDLENLYINALKGAVSGLGDKYSAYYTEDDYTSIIESTDGRFYGIGVYVSMNKEATYPVVSSVIKGGPAEESGIMAGDTIVEVNGKSIYKMDLDSAVALIKGEEGTNVTLTIAREGEEDYISIDVTRNKVEVITVEYEMLEDNIGYIQVSQFDGVTTKQFNRAVDELTEDGMEALVIDLRNNPGGYLGTATTMLDKILPENKLLVYTEDKNGKREEYYSEDSDTVEVPIAIIMNSSSASASEVFAGCLKDYDKAVIVGEQSFGKGIVQSLYSFADKTGIKLTTAAYYSPYGYNIHGTGITPDVPAEDNPELEGDEQLQAAIDKLKEN